MTPEDTKDNLSPLIIIAGPTATGKSKAAVALAKSIHGAVISADSMQIYKGMDIGSAKITVEEMQGVPHYLVDEIDPKEEWNIVRFQKEAKESIQEIYGKGYIPILCGGTGFYIQSVLYDIDFKETGADCSYREELLEIANTEGAAALYEMLRNIDPEAADSIHPNNLKRVIRALEYAKETGEKISVHNEAERGKKMAYNAAFFVLTQDRKKLYEKIDRRVDRMFEEGLLDEVKALKARGLKDTDVSMQGIGYKEILWYLDGKLSLEEAQDKIKLETRHFAKRQLTWFKREQNAIFVDRDLFDSDEALNSYLLEKTEEIIHVHP